MILLAIIRNLKLKKGILTNLKIYKIIRPKIFKKLCPINLLIHIKSG